MLEEIAHDAGVIGMIESIPDDVLEEAFSDFLSCPVCTGRVENADHLHNIGSGIHSIGTKRGLRQAKKR
jgi:hypothetical protein